MIKLGKIAVLFLVVLYACQSGQTENREADSRDIAVDSIDILTGMIEEDSANYKLFAKRSAMRLERGQLDPAFRDLSLAIEINPNDAELYLLLGDIYFIIGKKENCLQSYRKAVELSPGDVKPLLKLAETHLIIKQYDQADIYLAAVLKLDVNNPNAYFYKGVRFMETGDTSNALLNLKIAGNLDSTYYEAFMQTGSIYSAMGDSLAIDYFKAAARALPDDPRAMLLLAVTYQVNKKFNQALKVYKDIQQKYPAEKTAFFNAGYIYMTELFDFDKAKEAFNRAIAIDPAYVDAVYNLGRIFEEEGNYADARIQYRQALELETNYPLAIEGLNRLDERQYQ